MISVSSEMNTVTPGLLEGKKRRKEKKEKSMNWARVQSFLRQPLSHSYDHPRLCMSFEIDSCPVAATGRPAS